MHHAQSFWVSVLTLWCVPLFALSTTRSGNIFTADEDMVLTTTVSGTANWTLTGQIYGETVSGTAPVVGGRITIPLRGILYDIYTISVSGDGSITGAVLPPLMEIHPDLNVNMVGLYERRLNPADALMWKQIGVLEFRFEGGLSFSSAEQAFIDALVAQGVRPSFKLHLSDPPSNYDTFETQCRNFIAQYYPRGVESYYTINEPDGCGWWSGCWNEYYLVQERFYRAKQQAAPDAIMYAPEMWSAPDDFIRQVLLNRHHDVFSTHYASDDPATDRHSGYHFTWMRKIGYITPMISGEAQDMNDNYDQAEWAKFYPGEYPGGVSMTWGLAPGHYDFGMHRILQLGFILYGASPFASFSSAGVTPGRQCLQCRQGNDGAVGTQYIGRLPNQPINVVGYMMKRGSDRYFVAHCPVGATYQLLEIETASPKLTIKDSFGNEYPATPTQGKVYVLLANTEVWVHGLTANDTINYIQRTQNYPPEIDDPGPQTAAVGVPFTLPLRGRDPELVVTANGKRLGTWSIVSGPTGMTIGQRSGLIRWTPTAAGTQNVTVRLADTDGGTVSRTFTITVLSSGSNLAPVFVSRAAPVASKGRLYKYPMRAVDPNGDALTYRLVNGPAGMTCSTTGYLTWGPNTIGTYTVQVEADDGRGGVATQSFEVAVVPNPDKPALGVVPPPRPTDLTITESGPSAITMVWNPHHFGEIVVQRAPARSGPWTDIGVVPVPATWFRDETPPAGPVFYRVVARNPGGDSDPSNVVNGRNRAPIAEAGRSVKLTGPGTAQLDGTASFDPDNSGPLTYQWKIFTAPLGSNPTLANATAANASLTVSQTGRYVVGLRVSDGEEWSGWDYLWVVVGGDGSQAQRVCHLGPSRFMTLGSTATIVSWSTPANIDSNWHWRLDDFPKYGYVRFAVDTGYPRVSSNSFCPELPGVYEVTAKPKDDWLDGFLDRVKVIVAPVTSTGPLVASRLALTSDVSALFANGVATATISAMVQTADGRTVTGSSAAITFAIVVGSGTLLGDNPAIAQNGIARITFRAGTQPGTVIIRGTSPGLSSSTVTMTLNAPPNLPPQVTLTNPPNNSTYTAPATITLAATATDPDGTIASVRFYRGSTLLNADSTSPYEYTWVNVSSGTYQLRAVAQDNAGATSTSTVVTVTVLSSVTPAVWYTLTTQANPATGGTISPASGTYLAGSQIQVVATPNPNYVFTNWSGDATGTSPSITITMDGDKILTAHFVPTVPPSNSSPTVSITSPIDGEVYTAPASITISATASDSDGSITVVRFYAGTTLLGVDSTSPYAYTWTNVGAGSYFLSAQAEDNQGAVGTSGPVGITVNPAVAPAVQPVLGPGEVRVVGGVDGYINATTSPNALIRFRRVSAGVVMVKVYDLRGRLVFERTKDGPADTDDEVVWNVATTPAGVYVVRTQGSGTSNTKRVVVVR